MGHVSELKDILKGLFSSQSLAVLATHSHGQPYTNLVGFAATEDLQTILFATKRATHKYANIVSDMRVAMFMDNRSVQDIDFHHTIAVTATGSAEEVTDKEKGPFLELYLKKLPHLEEFVTSPTCALLKVNVETYYLVRRFQEVMILRITDTHSHTP